MRHLHGHLRGRQIPQIKHPPRRPNRGAPIPDPRPHRAGPGRAGQRLGRRRRGPWVPAWISDGREGRPRGQRERRGGAERGGGGGGRGGEVVILVGLRRGRAAGAGGGGAPAAAGAGGGHDGGGRNSGSGVRWRGARVVTRV